MKTQLQKSILLLLLLLLLLILSCTSEENMDTSTIEVTIENTTINSATISWTTPTNTENQTIVYKILINNNVIEDFYRNKTIIINNLNENQSYSGTIFALSSEGKESFKDFEFTTLKNPISYKHLKITTQEQIDKFYYTSALSLTIDGDKIDNLKGLKTLKGLDQFIVIKNTSIETFEGLENLRNTGVYPHLPQIEIENNDKLESILALSEYFSDALYIKIRDNTSLKSLNGLITSTNLISLSLDNLPISNFKDLSLANNSNSLYLSNLENVVNFEGLNNIENLHELWINNLINLESFQGLNNLKYVEGLYIHSNPEISSLMGLDSLYAEGSIRLSIKNNKNLSNFCSIVNYIRNSTIYAESFLGDDFINIYHFNLAGNAYNPSEDELRTNDKCKK